MVERLEAGSASQSPTHADVPSLGRRLNMHDAPGRTVHRSPGFPGRVAAPTLTLPMTNSPDPRVYFAAERTLLAWLRTGLTIMGFGFVVARFGLFLRLVSLQHLPGEVAGHGVSPVLGAALVMLGALATAYGGVAFSRHSRRLPPHDLPTTGAAVIPLLLTAALVVAGLVLVWVLLR